jgi:hypothetical protein
MAEKLNEINLAARTNLNNLATAKSAIEGLIAEDLATANLASIQKYKNDLNKLIPKDFDSKKNKSEANTELSAAEQKVFEDAVFSNQVKTFQLALGKREILLTHRENLLND